LVVLTDVSSGRSARALAATFGLIEDRAIDDNEGGTRHLTRRRVAEDVLLTAWPSSRLFERREATRIIIS
jgi:DNA integrity scanning protein DisA with diadenylate cyclase activity